MDTERMDASELESTRVYAADLSTGRYGQEALGAGDSIANLVDHIERLQRELAEVETQPDWADVREAARNAGWRIERDTHTVETYWNARRLDQDGHFDPAYGWVDIGVHDGQWRANLVSPGHPKSSVVLSDPTPSEVLEAARLVGLDGGTP